MVFVHRDWWELDPLPVPPDMIGTAAYWRWQSTRALAGRMAPVTRYDHELICDDCGTSDKYGQVWGFTGVVLPKDDASRVYCETCKRRRGVAYLFDARPWSRIAREDGAT